ncbi:MAG TPA: sigma-70 family RNA polymerase sigma factor [Polyangiaceae bacterium]|nr:sigma-70 family RNA polymerase sigma factor [Polyangiaceae bacterium]
MVAEGSGPSRASEEAFIARLKARDETAFNELVELYQQRVFALVFRMMGRRAEAEEITQDTFVQTFRYIDNFRGDSKLSTWLFRVAVNLTKNRMKRNARRGAGLKQDLDSVADHTELGSAEGVSVGSVERPDELAQGRQLEVIVKHAIMELEPDFRQLVILRDVEDLSYEEIAEVTGLPRGTVKSRIHRGRAQLRTKVERILGERLGKGNK